MKFVVISDTHAPNMLSYALEHVKQVLSTHGPDTIVINGDILGIFSMRSSHIHKKAPITHQTLLNYLKQAAPNFYASYSQKPLTQQAVLEYVKERYDWCVTQLKSCAEIKHTYFNMGNHESPYHFLVLQELAFLTNTNPPNVPDDKLQEIFANFEKQLAKLEQTHAFTYIRNKPVLEKDTLILPIPGESHDAVGAHFAAKMQEQKTKELIEKAKKLISFAKNIVIFNHTQGSYDRTTGMFQPLSPAIKQFMQEIPNNIKNKVFVQSHNHWSYTQFLQSNGFHFVLNNAGLHGGIYNMLDVTDNIIVHDVHPETNTITKLSASNQIITDQDAIKLIKRNYPNFLDVFMYRRSNMHDAIHPTLTVK